MILVMMDLLPKNKAHPTGYVMINTRYIKTYVKLMTQAVLSHLTEYREDRSRMSEDMFGQSMGSRNTID